MVTPFLSIKRKYRYFTRMALLSCLLGFSASLAAQTLPTVSIGTLTGQLDTLPSFTPFSDYLENQLPGYDFEVQGFDSIESIMSASERGTLDFALLTPAAFVELNMDRELRVLATITQPAGDTISPWLASAVFARESRNDINTMFDARDKRVVALSEFALGGWLAAAREWQDLGIDVDRNLAAVDFVFSYAAVIDAVCQGDADIGVMAASTLPSYATRCPEPLKTLPLGGATQQAEYPLPHSTRLYPEVAMVMIGPHDEEFIRNLSRALLDIEPGSNIAQAISVHGFTAPLNYSEVEALMQEFRLGPFSALGDVTLAKFLSDNIYPVTFVFIVIILMATAGLVNAQTLNRKFRESENYRKLVFEGSHIAMVVIDPKTNTFLDMNPAAVTLYGYDTRDDLLGKTVDQLSSTHQDFNMPIPESISMVGKQVANEGKVSFEWRHVRPNGEEWLGRVRLMLFESTNGNLIQATVEDITQQKRQDDDRRQLEQQLEFSQRMESIGRLAGGIAHDFNNLLTIINGYSEMLLMESDGESPEAKILEQIRKAGVRASELTQQLLTFSRKQVTIQVPVNVNETIRDSSDMMASVLGEGIRLDLELSEISGRVLSDPGQLQQVLLNLVVNAKDAMPNGGMLKISTCDTFITPQVAKTLEIMPGNYIEISIRDSGIGMDENIQRHIFEPFFTTKDHSGTGLGLSTVYGIVQQSKGTIKVTSARGEGATFRILLPETDVEETRQEEPESRITATLDSRTILVVEDQLEVREFVTAVLKRAGYDVLSADSGDAALGIMASRQEPVDLLLTDVIMEGMSGGELADVFRDTYPETPVLFVSGYPEDELTRHGVQQGSMEFLAKPYSPGELLARISQILHTSTAET